MEDTLHLDAFGAYLLSEDRSPVTIEGYLGDVRLFARWYEIQSTRSSNAREPDE
jgi:hypothetical protein